MTRLKNRFFAFFARLTPEVIFQGGLIFALLLAFVQAGLMLFVMDEFTRVQINDILVTISSLSATLAMLYAARWSYCYSRQLGNAWFLFMLSMAVWAIGDILWAYYELIVHEAPYPSVADIFYLSTYFFAFVAMLMLPRQSTDGENSVSFWLDIFIVMFSAIGIYWNFLIGPVFMTHQQPWVEVLIGLAYPMGDLLLICIISLIIFRPISFLWRRPMLLMLGGYTLSALVDSIFSYQTINDIYDSGAFFNILFSLSPLVLMLSGLAQAVQSERATNKQKTVPLQLKVDPLALFRLVVPFLWLLLAYMFLSFGAYSKQVFTSSQFSLLVSAIIVFLAIRQIYSMVENKRLASELQTLNENLEKHVAERTIALIQANNDLQREMGERQRVETMLREREEKLAHFALHDSLTGLPNRSLLIDRLSKAIQRHNRHRDERYAVLFLDFDSFKMINDSLGHLAGDQLLIQVGKRLTSLVRDEDTVARLGGDEFIILIEGIRNEDFVSIAANRILNSLKEPFLLENRPIYITASIGVVLADASYLTAMEVIRDADLAMYKAKTTGKAHHVLFTPELHLDAVTQLTLDSDIRKGLELGEFVLHYQPVISLETNFISGFEALIRWQHPTRGLIGPAEFIPVAENNGLIDSITQWVIREACQQFGEWQASFAFGEDLRMSINLSPRSLKQFDLCYWVEQSLTAASLSPRCLTIEIVETALMQDADLANQVFACLRELGIKVGLDDFGMGFSSLGYLNQYPIDILKIDRSFVSQVTASREVGAVVRAIATLASELGIEIVAEGIETRQQLDFMKQVGCHYGQGFYFYKPLNVQAAQTIIQRQFQSNCKR